MWRIPDVRDSKTEPEPGRWVLTDESKSVHGTVGPVVSKHKSEQSAKLAKLGYKPSRLSVFKLRDGVNVSVGQHIILHAHVQPSSFQGLH